MPDIFFDPLETIGQAATSTGEQYSQIDQGLSAVIQTSLGLNPSTANQLVEAFDQQQLQGSPGSSKPNSKPSMVAIPILAQSGQSSSPEPEFSLPEGVPVEPLREAVSTDPLTSLSFFNEANPITSASPHVDIDPAPTIAATGTSRLALPDHFAADAFQTETIFDPAATADNVPAPTDLSTVDQASFKLPVDSSTTGDNAIALDLIALGALTNAAMSFTDIAADNVSSTISKLPDPTHPVTSNMVDAPTLKPAEPALHVSPVNFNSSFASANQTDNFTTAHQLDVTAPSRSRPNVMTTLTLVPQLDTQASHADQISAPSPLITTENSSAVVNSSASLEVDVAPLPTVENVTAFVESTTTHNQTNPSMAIEPFITTPALVDTEAPIVPVDFPSSVKPVDSLPQNSSIPQLSTDHPNARDRAPGLIRRILTVVLSALAKQRAHNSIIEAAVTSDPVPSIPSHDQNQSVVLVTAVAEPGGVVAAEPAVSETQLGSNTLVGPSKSNYRALPPYSMRHTATISPITSTTVPASRPAIQIVESQTRKGAIEPVSAIGIPGFVQQTRCPGVRSKFTSLIDTHHSSLLLVSPELCLSAH